MRKFRQSITVIYEEHIVGYLAEQERVLSFSYHENWLKMPNAFPISPHLPLSTVHYHGNSVLFFFSNLLPEGHVLSTILKLKRLSLSDIYGQLEAFGEEVAGAFSIVHLNAFKKKEHADEKYRKYTIEAIENDLLQLSQHMPLLMQHQTLHLSLAGAQNKIPVKYEYGEFFLPVNGSPSTHILKPAIQPSHIFKDSVWNEALCLRLAKYCGLNAVSLEVILFSQPVLVIERYDRTQIEGKIQRLHQLDFCQLTERLPDQKYEKDGGISFEIIFDAVDHYTDEPGPNRLKVLDWLLFNYIIGNADAHAKNLAVLVLPGNKVQLAPFYDMVCTELYDSLDTRMAMAIGGEYRPKWVRKKNWHLLAEQLSINITLLQQRAFKLAEAMSEQLLFAAKNLKLQEDHLVVKKIARVIQERSRWLKVHL